MKKSENSEYNFDILANDTTYYPTDRIINVISQATFDYQFSNLPEKREMAIHLGMLEKVDGEIDTIYNQFADAIVSNRTPTNMGNLKLSEDESHYKKELQDENLIKKNLSDYYDTIKNIYIDEELRDQNYYFMDRIIKSVLNNEIELWNSDTTKVMALPVKNKDFKLNEIDNEIVHKPMSLDIFLHKVKEDEASILDGSLVKAYRNKPKNRSIYSPLHRTARYCRQYTGFEDWISRTYIHKSDLVKFCKNQRIEVVFESDQSTENSSQQQEEQIVENSEAEEINVDISIPGKIPRICIGKLAIEIAWQIERDSGKFAKPSEVMKVLQQWAEEGKHSDILRKKIGKNVGWSTQDDEDRIYTLGGCRLALGRWKLSRKNNDNPNK